MTTNLSPAGRGRHHVDVHDPAELLAEARLCLRETPTDCLILAGSGGPRSPAIVTRSSLRDLLAPRGAENLERHLALMQERGAGALHALIVIGDGYQRLLEPVVENLLLRAGALVHDAAREVFAGAVPGLLTVRAAASSTCWELEARPDGGRPRLFATEPLRAFSDTRAAAGAVLIGRPIPYVEPEDPALAEIGKSLHLHAEDLASGADPGELFAIAREALGQLLSGSEDLSGTTRMTKCEQIASLLSAVAVDRLHWELMAQCVERGTEREIDRETLLQDLVSDTQLIPHEDVCAGGSWYVALERLRSIAAAACEAVPVAELGTARSAWRALTALLVLLAWWNHRFATAGHLVDEIREREPESTLAPLLSRMTDPPIFPAWWPRA